MSIQRTPPHSGTGSGSFSSPNLTKLVDDEDHMKKTSRFLTHSFNLKRKTQDFDSLQLELSDTLSSFQLKLADTLSEFRESTRATIDSLFIGQNENITLLREDISIIHKQVCNIQQVTTKLEHEQCQLKTDLTNLARDNNNTASRVSLLEKQLTETKNEVVNLSTQLLAREQQGRINNLEITGIPLAKGENLYSLLDRIAQKIGIPLASSDVDYVHRVRRFLAPILNKEGQTTSSSTSRAPNIIVRFTQRKRKAEFLTAVRARRGLTTADLDIDGPSSPVFVNDHLAPQNKVIYGRARKLGRELGYKYIWLNDCKIFLRKSDESKAILIASESDLDKIK